MPNLDFEKEQVGLETVKDLGQQDRARRVHLRRVRTLPGELPGVGRRQGAESEDASSCRRRRRCSPGERETKLGELYSEKVLWQCTTCGACENQCPVGIEHLPLIIGARRGLVSNGDAPDYLGGDVQQPRAPRRTSGAWATTSGRSSSTPPALEMFDPAKHDVLVWLGCAGAFEADFQKSLRSLFDILRAQQVTLRRAGEGALHRRSGQAHRQRVHVPGAGEREHRGSQGRRRRRRSSRRARTA